MDTTGTGLWVDRATAVLPQGRNMRLHIRSTQIGIWRLSLEQIEATVADHLGTGRVPGNQAASLFESAGFHVSGEERGGLEHDQNRQIL